MSEKERKKKKRKKERKRRERERERVDRLIDRKGCIFLSYLKFYKHKCSHFLQLLLVTTHFILVSGVVTTERGESSDMHIFATSGQGPPRRPAHRLHHRGKELRGGGKEDESLSERETENA